MDEFELIDQIFHGPEESTSQVAIGIGDDGAVINVTAGKQAVVVMDTLVADVHFLESQPADSIGHRALAVNLSDIAAMGAVPRWATLSLTLSEMNQNWLNGFAHGFFELAGRHEVALIGGDTTTGPLAVSVTVGGEVEAEGVLRRAGARPGDFVYLSGPIGGAAAALSSTEAYADSALHRALCWPQPRTALGAALGSIAHSAIDVSDGLLADLGHILKASGNLGAEIEADKLPLFKQAVALLGYQGALELALGGGDDYELCFTAPEKRHQEILATGHRLDQDLFWIGRITEHGGCSIHGSEINLDTVSPGYQHVWPR
tara:strand:- start:224 stop:1174 length:951 start_codon:yes stop_codon:yes gene_type:complete